MTSRRAAAAGSGAPNPKRDPDPPSNTVKPPDQWVSGDEPMTGAQASYLKTLSEEAREREAFSNKLSKAEASRRIDALKAKLRLQDGPPHTL
jgi:hypothetical protein